MTKKMEPRPYIRRGIRRSIPSIPNRLRRRAKGFSLAELQVAIIITAIVLVASLSLYISHWRTFLIGNAYIDVYSNSRLAVDWMARDIRWAAQVMPSSDYGSYATSDNSLVIKIPSIDTSGNVMNGYYDNIIYQLQGSNLRRIVQIDQRLSSSTSGRQNETRIIAKYCSSLTFSSKNSSGNVVALSQFSSSEMSTINYIAIYLPLSETVASLSGAGTGTAQLTPTTIVKLRNK
ncbi:MAG: hypothetical protein A3G36_00710 [Omnitrophica bacterium RIFCSPLOWO2_12_FULL_45_13]|nr:MAG: hypothetical protein A3G36_00710 [Omnitrophica bacterium RIFCSPLOWO2_12_FULL_45_13]